VGIRVRGLEACQQLEGATIPEEEVAASGEANYEPTGEDDGLHRFLRHLGQAVIQ
jgi:hypothetical protein